MAIDAKTQDQLQRQLDALVTQQRDLVMALQSGQGHFQQLARSVWRVQEEERRRLARELHDGIGQNLAAILHLLDNALIDAEASGLTAHEGVTRARALTESTIAEARALSRQLRPQILDDLGLVAALRWLARTFRDNHALNVNLDVAETLPPISEDAQTLVFRVVQEGLNNISRHSAAATANISVRVTDREVRLELRDDGKGCDPRVALRTGSEGQGSGLGGMRDRVRLFGGELRIDSAPGKGFAIEIEFPFAANTGTLGQP
jgi:two-component system, NarL family, sensor kinase